MNKEIAILMQDHCTEFDAKKHLKNGTIIYDNPEEYLTSLKEIGAYTGETLDDIRQGKCADISMVKFEGHEYLIMYVL